VCGEERGKVKEGKGKEMDAPPPFSDS